MKYLTAIYWYVPGYMSAYMNDNMNDSFRKEPDAGKLHVRNFVRDISGNGCIYSTYE